MATEIPQNWAPFSQAEIIASTSATLMGQSPLSSCVGVTSDSRGDVTGKLFVALSGERFDGHQYAEEVLARGAYGVVVERDLSGEPPGLVFTVPSTLRALANLALWHRRRWGKTVVTIGGSAGKTTTRAAVQAFLSALLPGRVCGTVGNLNNLVGVPMTLLAIQPQHEIAVVEVGTNQRGEVERLSECCEANVALLTCIGLEHSEGLGDLDGVEAEEGAIFHHLAAGACLVGLGDDARVRRQMELGSLGARCWFYGKSADGTHQILRRTTLNRERTELEIARKWRARPDTLTLHTRLLGLPGALASTAAVAVADALDIPVEGSKALSALDREVGETGRLRILERTDRALVIDDCYNANPVSMRSSIEVAREIALAEDRRIVFVLGDMRELGQLSAHEHACLAEELDGAVQVFAIGPEMEHLARRVEQRGQKVRHFSDAESAISSVCAAIGPKDVVLVKGSRGIKLERVVAAITGGGGNSP